MGEGGNSGLGFCGDLFSIHADTACFGCDHLPPVWFDSHHFSGAERYMIENILDLVGQIFLPVAVIGGGVVTTILLCVIIVTTFESVFTE